MISHLVSALQQVSAVSRVSRLAGRWPVSNVKADHFLSPGGAYLRHAAHAVVYSLGVEPGRECHRVLCALRRSRRTQSRGVRAGVRRSSSRFVRGWRPVWKEVGPPYGLRNQRPMEPWQDIKSSTPETGMVFSDGDGVVRRGLLT